MTPTEVVPGDDPWRVDALLIGAGITVAAAAIVPLTSGRLLTGSLLWILAATAWAIGAGWPPGPGAAIPPAGAALVSILIAFSAPARRRMWARTGRVDRVEPGA